MADESDLLTHPLTRQLLGTHPNAHATQPLLPIPLSWLDLLCLYSAPPTPAARVSGPFARLIASARDAQLPRTPIPIHALPLPSLQGMSPKKAHEVARMATYVVALAARLPPDAVHIVDIGAGQGYLTRTLKAHLPHAHILALDADTEQTRAAQRWESRLLPKANPSIEHRVVYISPQSLLATVDEWAIGPVIFVALHACGSLTPDVLRAFVSAANNPSKNWHPASLVAVGCCYNLMNPSDFPPSTQHLPLAAYHLAAQIPSQWLLPSDPPTLDPAAALSIRKVAWRALLEKALQNATPAHPVSESPQNNSHSKSATVPARWSQCSEPSSTEPQFDTSESATAIHRLGRLRDSAYTSWNTFLRAAAIRMDVVFHPDEFDDDDIDDDEQPSTMSKGRGRDRDLENQLASLHVMRCLLGPAIESAILRDRIQWVRQELGIDTRELQSDNTTDHSKLRAELVNLFDQSTGSGRNVAIVIAPANADVFRLFPSPEAASSPPTPPSEAPSTSSAPPPPPANH